MLRASVVRGLSLGLLVALLIAPSARADVDGTLSVAGNANIFGAGHTVAPAPAGPASPGAGGALPPGVTFAAQGGRVLTLGSVTGTSSGGLVCPSVGPDGTCDATKGTAIDGTGGIQGIADGAANQMLVGVFLDGTEPADPVPTWRADFSPGALGHDLPVLAPGLGRPFFVGDGLTGTGTGTKQQWVVPAGATRLYLGFADGSDWTGAPGYYDDNSGSLSVPVHIGAPAALHTWDLYDDFVTGPDGSPPSAPWSYLSIPVGGVTATPLSHYESERGGFTGLQAWSGDVATGNGNVPVVTRNTTNNDVAPVTNVIPAHSIAVHPWDDQEVAVRWTSPIDGTVRVSGLLASDDPNGGDGTGWRLDKNGGVLGMGAVPVGGQQSLRQGTIKAPETVTVAKGDKLTLRIGPNAGSDFDTTQVQFRVEQLTTTGRPAATLSPSAPAFGNVQVGHPLTKNVTLKNSGTAPMHVSGQPISTNSAWKVTGCAGATIGAGQTCSLQVTFSPAHNGPYGGTLKVAGDAPAAAALSGTGLVAGATSDIYPPRIAIASPALTSYPKGQGPGPLAFSCTETRPGDSGAKDCAAALDGKPVAYGAALPKSGTHTVRVTATDFAGHTATKDATYSVQSYSVTQFPPAPPQPPYIAECDRNNAASYDPKACTSKQQQVAAASLASFNAFLAPSVGGLFGQYGTGALDVIGKPSWNVISSGGGNVISSGGGNVIAWGTGKVDGNVISSGGGNLVDVGFPKGELVDTHPRGDVISTGGANVISSGGGNVISSGGGNVISSGGGNVFGNVISSGGGNVIASGGGNLIYDVAGWALRARDGHVIASGGGNVIASGGGNVISSGGGNVISSGGGNVISSGGGNFHLRDGNWLGSLLGNNVTAGNLWLAKDASFVQIYNGAPGGITMPQLASSVGTLTTSVTASNTFLRPQGASAAKARPVALAKATTRVRHKGVVIVRLKLTKAGRALVARRHKAKRKSQAKAIRLTITTRLKPKKGKAVTRTRRVTAKPVRTPYR